MKLPTWAPTLRPHQLLAIQGVLDEYNSGHNVVLLDAPTGSGKTLIGDLVRQSINGRGLYLCSSIALQEQFSRDFPEAAILKGRSNYPTADTESRFPELSAADCDKSRTTIPACYDCTGTIEEPTVQHCRFCHPITNCPYEQAKYNAIRAELACTNTYYFLYEANYVGTLPLNRQLIIVDEADTLETVLLQFVSVSISKKKAEEYGIQPPAKKTVESSWIEWAQTAESTLQSLLGGDKARSSSLEGLRYKKQVERLLGNVRRLNSESTGLQAGGWVYTGYDKGDIAFKPIQVDHLAKDFLWRHCKKWLLMSASFISFQAVAENLGIDDYEVVS